LERSVGEEDLYAIDAIEGWRSMALQNDPLLGEAPEYEQAYMQLQRFKQKYPEAYASFSDDMQLPKQPWELDIPDDYYDVAAVPSIMGNFADMEAAGV